MGDGRRSNDTDVVFTRLFCLFMENQQSWKYFDG